MRWELHHCDERLEEEGNGNRKRKRRRGGVLLSFGSDLWPSALRAAEATFQTVTVTKESGRCFMVDNIQEEVLVED